VHQAFLNAGGLGILVADDQPPSPGSEEIIEMNDKLPHISRRMTFVYQFVANPGLQPRSRPWSQLLECGCGRSFNTRPYCPSRLEAIAQHADEKEAECNHAEIMF
jgi:hypothetical protein